MIMEDEDVLTAGERLEDEADEHLRMAAKASMLAGFGAGSVAMGASNVSAPVGKADVSSAGPSRLPKAGVKPD